jgi:hypothetical protein
MRPKAKQMILGLCVFSLSLSAIACSPKTKDTKQTITVNTPPAASVPTNEDKAIPKYDHIFVIIQDLRRIMRKRTAEAQRTQRNKRSERVFA